ncbi:NAD(P)/FAD-dependent oxidoreductase [Klenkia soli]|nr:geranylgeranyl reductase family protein [Klenkia soli]
MEATDPMEAWDVVVVGGGPAGAAAALAARRHGASVLVLDRADFPRDKVCGDGIAPEALDVLAALGVDVDAVTHGYPAVPRLRLTSPSGRTVERAMHRPAVVVPRAVLDGRVLEAALAAGAQFRRHTVRQITPGPDGVDVDGVLTTGVLVGADGAESVVRRALGTPANRPDRLAIAIRGYAPTSTEGVQVITTTDQRWPAYAWSFPIGDGRANVGYGELVGAGATRAELLAGLHRLLPGVEPEQLRAHRLPLSTGRPRQPDGRVLLAGDAASLINPMTGEGIFYAVLSGAFAGAAAAHGAQAGRVFRTALRQRLGTHLRHTSAASRLSSRPWLMDAAFGAAAADQRVFDDVVALGLADGRLTARTLVSAVGTLSRRR